MSTSILPKNDTDSKAIDELAKPSSDIDWKSDHWCPFLVLWGCLRYRLLEPNGVELSQEEELAFKHEIWHMVEEHSVSLEQACNFEKSVPKPRPKPSKSKQALTAWWNTWREDIQEGPQHMKDRYQSAKIGQHGVTICSETGNEITVPFSALQGLSRTIAVAQGPEQQEPEQSKQLRRTRSLGRQVWYG